MTGFNDLRFNNMFARIQAAHDPGLNSYSWEADGVQWSRHRHAFHGPDYTFQCETFVLTRSSIKAPWKFLYVTETWWASGGKNVLLRSSSWGKAIKGRNPDVMTWMKSQIALIDKKA